MHRKKYSELLLNRVERVWSFERTLDSLLKHLGQNPIRNTRYFWKGNHGSRPQELSPGNLRTVVDALFISLHDYPQASPVLERRCETQFVDFEKSLAGSKTNPRNRVQRKEPLDVHWLEGLLDYFNVKFPYESDDPRKPGFSVARQVIGLHLVELLLKYALEGLKIG